MILEERINDTIPVFGIPLIDLEIKRRIVNSTLLGVVNKGTLSLIVFTLRLASFQMNEMTLTSKGSNVLAAQRDQVV